jgi:vancomycin resistance protein YoaR
MTMRGRRSGFTTRTKAADPLSVAEAEARDARWRRNEPKTPEQKQHQRWWDNLVAAIYWDTGGEYGNKRRASYVRETPEQLARRFGRADDA